MFKAVDLNMGPGPIKNAWLRLNRQIQTEVEHKRVTNSGLVDFVKGDIVSLDAGNRQAVLAQADALATSRFAAIMAEPTPAGEQGVARSDGYALIHMETGLAGAIADAEGSPIYLSATVAGRGAMAIPGAGFSIIVAMLADGTEYSDANPFVWGIIGHCCAPTEAAPG